ncbi:MAG: YczE/YyaS/YitT family protein [Microbacteriaceae bacterium]
MNLRRLTTQRYSQLLIGLVLYGIGIGMILRAGLGVAPWDVLSQGIDAHTGWGFGLITVLLSGIVLLLWIPIRQRPGIGTVLNALIVGPAAELGLWLIPTGLELWLRIVLLSGGILTIAVATGLYIGADRGPGPRDGLMTGLVARTGLPIWLVRTALEGSVLLIGWLLGGSVGIGTLAFALLIGPLCGLTIPLFSLPPVSATPADEELVAT